MDLKQIEYIVKIAETGSITKAAEQLFITQSALNQQLLKLEQQLGIKLFVRHKHDLAPTSAGQVYLEYGQNMLREKREAYNIIHDMAQNSLGDLRLTFSRERGIDMLVSTYPQFHRRFPGITLRPHEMFVVDQLNYLSRGDIDLGVVTITEKQKRQELEFELIRREPLLLAVPRESPRAINPAKPGAPLEELPYLPVDQYKDSPFVLMFPKSTMRQLIDQVLKEADYHPYVLFESASVRALLTMVKDNMACTMVAAGYYRYQDKIAYYRIPGNPYWEMCITYKKGAYLNRAMQYYKELIQEYFRTKDPLFVKK